MGLARATRWADDIGPRPGRRRVVAVRLREHDLLVRRRLAARSGLWLVADERFGERDGNFVLSVAIVVSVGLNALVSPILGALSDRGGRRMPYLLFFTLLCIVPTVGSSAGVRRRSSASCCS